MHDMQALVNEDCRKQAPTPAAVGRAAGNTSHLLLIVIVLIITLPSIRLLVSFGSLSLGPPPRLGLGRLRRRRFRLLCCCSSGGVCTGHWPVRSQFASCAAVQMGKRDGTYRADRPFCSVSLLGQGQKWIVFPVLDSQCTPQARDGAQQALIAGFGCTGGSRKQSAKSWLSALRQPVNPHRPSPPVLPQACPMPKRKPSWAPFPEQERYDSTVVATQQRSNNQHRSVVQPDNDQTSRQPILSSSCGAVTQPPPPPRDTTSRMADKEELFDLVDDADNVIGTELRSIVHQKGARHMHMLPAEPAPTSAAQPPPATCRAALPLLPCAPCPMLHYTRTVPLSQACCTGRCTPGCSAPMGRCSSSGAAHSKKLGAASSICRWRSTCSQGSPTCRCAACRGMGLPAVLCAVV